MSLEVCSNGIDGFQPVAVTNFELSVRSGGQAAGEPTRSAERGQRAAAACAAA
jgi:hypothetical protein